MQITDVRVRRLDSEGKLKAIASIVIDAQFVVHDLRIIEGTNGLFVSMPRRKTQEGEFKDLAHPITAEARDLVHKAVLAAYTQVDERQAGD